MFTWQIINVQKATLSFKLPPVSFISTLIEISSKQVAGGKERSIRRVKGDKVTEQSGDNGNEYTLLLLTPAVVLNLMS